MDILRFDDELHYFNKEKYPFEKSWYHQVEKTEKVMWWKWEFGQVI